MSQLAKSVSIRALIVAVGLAAASCGSSSPSTPSTTSSNMTASELTSISTSLFGGIGTGLQSSTTGSAPKTIGAILHGPFSITPRETFQIPYTPVTPSTVKCPAGGSYSQAGGVSGSINVDSGLAKISGTVIMVDTDCQYTAGTLINGDPYLSALLDYTQTGTPWSMTITMSGGWSVQVPGHPKTSVLIDPSGIHMTLGSNQTSRIQGSMTAYPGGVSVSLNQTF